MYLSTPLKYISIIHIHGSCRQYLPLFRGKILRTRLNKLFCWLPPSKIKYTLLFASLTLFPNRTQKEISSNHFHQIVKIRFYETSQWYPSKSEKYRVTTTTESSCRSFYNFSPAFLTKCNSDLYIFFLIFCIVCINANSHQKIHSFWLDYFHPISFHMLINFPKENRSNCFPGTSKTYKRIIFLLLQSDITYPISCLC